MTVRFKGTQLRPVLAEAAANQCRVILVKDQGVYFMAERGESRPDGRRKTMAYAVGCNPDVDAFDDWWELARAEFGGDDFGEFFDLAGTGVRPHPAQRGRPRSVGHGHASVDAAHARCAGRSLIVLLPSPLTGASLYLVARLRAASHALVSSPTRAAHAGTVPSRRIIGVVIVGCPVARNLDDGWTLEVTRLCTDGTANACSKLYAGRLPRGTRVGLHAPHHLHAAGRGRGQPAGGRLAPGRTVATGTERAGRARTPPRRCACPSWCGRRRSGEAWRLLPMRTAAGADCRSRACRRSATLGPCSADFGQQHARAVSIFKTATRFRPR